MPEFIITNGTKSLMTDGRAVKALELWGDSQDGWTALSGGTKEATLRGMVAYLYRCYVERANLVAAMPFVIKNAAGEVIDDSQNYQDDLNFLPDPVKLFWQIEASLESFGRAYIFKNANKSGVVKELKFLRADTITEIYDKTSGELTGYERTVNGKKRQTPYLPAEIIAIYLPDETVEAGPPDNWPVKTAEYSAAVLAGVNSFAASFLSRGAIKVTILGVPANTMADERKRLDTWWKRMMSGVKNAFSSAVFNVGAITPVVIGGGLEELGKNSELTKEARREIGYAMGFPETYFMSGGASGIGGGGVASTDKRKVYDGTIIPDCMVIQSSFNAQLGGGYRLEFQPMRLPEYSKDLTAAVNSLNSLSQFLAGAMTPAQKLLGLELAGITLSDEQQAVLVAAPEAPAPAPDNAVLKELKNWERRALKNIGKPFDFITLDIPAAQADEIRAGLKTAESAEAVRSLFAKAGGAGNELAAVVRMLELNLAQMEAAK